MSALFASLAAVSLFFTAPAPLEMPRAAAYLAHDGPRRYLVDRFSPREEWAILSVLGRWMDEDLRVFTLAELKYRLPNCAADERLTRTELRRQLVGLDRRDPKALAAAVAGFYPEAVAKGVPPRQLPHGYAEVRYFQGTNLNAIVCAYRPERVDTWRLAIWELTPGDDFDFCLAAFERDFLAARADAEIFARMPPEPAAGASERELLRYSAARTVAAYPDWHVTDGVEFSVLDALPTRDFTVALTNELGELRRRYAEAVPTPLDGTNVLAVARIFASRDDYLDAVGPELEWTAAYWSTARRELVAYLPEGGDAKLLATFRHEAFHQYLAYALSMIAASPWLNEGYASYFERGDAAEWPFPVTPESIDAMAEALPAILTMDYARFYDGTTREREVKYAIAWSIAYFLEHGAPQVRFAPFKHFKRDYVNSLLESRDMVQATSDAFGNPETLKLFIDEWKRYWKER